MTDIAGYLEECRTLALHELGRMVPVTSTLGSVMDSVMRKSPSHHTSGLRAALCLATCRALGGGDVVALPAAAVIELYDAALAPDCRAEARSVAHGSVSLTSDSGNAMLALSLGPLIECFRGLGVEQLVKLLQVVGQIARETSEGERLELSWIQSDAWILSDADYRGMVLKKHGWHSFVAPVKMGAISAGAQGEQIAVLEQFAADLSFAFQIYEDIANVSKETDDGEFDPHAIASRHHLPLMHALRAAPVKDRVWMSALLKERAALRHDSAAGDSSPSFVQQGSAEDMGILWRRVLQARASARNIGLEYALRSKAALDRTEAWLPDSPHRGLLYALLDFTCGKLKGSSGF